MVMTLKEGICLAEKLPRNDGVLMGRAELLCQDDRDLLEAVLVHGQPTAVIARMTGASQRAVRARVHRLCRRLRSGRFLAAARSLPYLTADDANVAKLAFCQHLPQRELCRQLGISWHALRRRLDRISAQIETIMRISRQRSDLTWRE